MKPNFDDLLDEYAVRYGCMNCGKQGVMSLKKGIKAESQHKACPHCGCYNVLAFLPYETEKMVTM